MENRWKKIKMLPMLANLKLVKMLAVNKNQKDKN